jgi:hypothetical protein
MKKRMDISVPRVPNKEPEKAPEKRDMLHIDSNKQFRSRLNSVMVWSGDRTLSATIRRLVNTEYLKLRQSGMPEEL